MNSSNPRRSSGFAALAGCRSADEITITRMSTFSFMRLSSSDSDEIGYVFQQSISYNRDCFRDAWQG